MINGCGNLPKTKMLPFTSPTSAPVPIIASAVAAALSVSLKTSARTTEDRARFEPTDRSIPRVNITRCCPIATTEITAVWAKMLLILRPERKCGVKSATIVASKINTISGPKPRTRNPSSTFPLAGARANAALETVVLSKVSAKFPPPRCAYRKIVLAISGCFSR